MQIQVDEQRQQIILTSITREYIHSLRGRYKGKNLIKALMEEKKARKRALRPHKAELVTGDRKFKQLENDSVKIQWLD